MFSKVFKVLSIDKDVVATFLNIRKNTFSKSGFKDYF